MTAREPVFVRLNCPACGQECDVLVLVSQVIVTRASLGDKGSLTVDFAQSWQEHTCDRA